ncbi:hypothetical protein QEZ47_07600 [Aminobacter anthyllidis]|uniref:hypothetical protein n=1 Tax=Aminobacter anthyllidis TaxID=1035067 RepID=UPI00245900FC|nr:hypothetical protein [Aminobacter anthyllidis]MDH4985406.1 hypothetical protein [Aminobacter anthyllidis]
MAKTPSNDRPGHQPDQSPSLGSSATGQKIDVALTGSARIHAGKVGLDGVLNTLKLSPECHTGDVVTVSAGGEVHNFAVLRRRWIVDATSNRLEITLDYPVRGR